MPRGRIDQTFYLGPFASIEAFNSATLYKPGELGSQFQGQVKAYQLIQVDSGAVAATTPGVPVCGQLAYWKNRSTYTVTNDARFAEGYRAVTGAGANSVAGVFVSLTSGAAGTASITPGNYGWIQQRGTHVGVSTGSNTVASGQTLHADTATTWTTTPTANAVADTLGTGPAYTPVGVATAANSAVTTNYTPARLGGWDLVDQP